MVFNLKKVIKIKEMFSEEISVHLSSTKLNYFSLGYVILCNLCNVFTCNLPLPSGFKKIAHCLSSPNCAISFTTAKCPVEMVDARPFKTLQRLETNCFQTEIFTEKLIRVSEN